MFKGGNVRPHELKAELMEIMWENVAIIRNEEGLKLALARIEEIQNKLPDMKVSKDSGYSKDLLDAIEIQNMLEVASLVIQSALIRRESRGSQYREDYPDRDERWNRSIVMNKNKDFSYIRRGMGCNTCKL